MRRYGKDADEDDIRNRPARRGSRPRTRIRPKHDDAAEAMILTIDRGRLTCLVDAGTKKEREVVAMKARELGRKGVVVGDLVDVVGDLSGEPDTLARIVRVAERTSVLRRTADDDDPVERVIVANADQLVVVTALSDPEPRPRLVDRALVAEVHRRVVRAADDQVGVLFGSFELALRSQDRGLGRTVQLARARVTGSVLNRRIEIVDRNAARPHRRRISFDTNRRFGSVNVYLRHAGQNAQALAHLRARIVVQLAGRHRVADHCEIHDWLVVGVRL